MRTTTRSSKLPSGGLLRYGWVAGWLLVGCVTVTDLDTKAERHAPLMVARSGGYALLSWDSEMGSSYTVLYTDGPRQLAEWRPLPGAGQIRGTGREIRLEDRLPTNQPRHYRLMVSQPN